jgi:uncharacterized protein YcbX
MHLSEINIYPVKSLKGISLQSSVVEPKGLEFDRRWIVVDAGGKFLTQRELPRMATIEVRVTCDGLEARGATGESINVQTPSAGDRVTTEVWGRPGVALRCDSETNEWFSDVLGAEVELRYMPGDAGRPVRPPFDRNGHVTGFADGYPLLLIGEASLADLNERIGRSADALVRMDGASPSRGPLNEGQAAEDLADRCVGSPLPMNRFRPNLVVAAAEPFAEDDWSRIRVGEAVFRSTKPCDRCVMTTVDQAKGEFAGKEPLKTLATYRKAVQVIPDRYESYFLPPNSVLFGQNLIPETSGVTIRVGDDVEVIERY